MSASKNTQRTTEQSTTPRCEHCSTYARCVFAALTLQEREQIWSFARERSVAVGEPLEAQGVRSQTLGVVKVGLLKGMRRGPGDVDRPILLMGKGRLVGSTELSGQSATLSLVSITPTRICEVDLQAVRNIALQSPSFQNAIDRTLAAFMGCMADWSHVMRQESYLTKVCAALHLIAVEEGNPSFRIPSHSELADVLGTRRETIARQITLLVKKGLLSKMDRRHGLLTTSDYRSLLKRPEKPLNAPLAVPRPDSVEPCGAK